MVTNSLVKPEEYRVFEYQHVDDFRCFSSIWSLLGECNSLGPEEASMIWDTLETLQEMFREAGWEGDGNIMVWWVPPFASNSDSTHCTAIFHVKQANNGSSWICVPRWLKLRWRDRRHQGLPSRLAEFREWGDGSVPITMEISRPVR